MSFCIPPAGRCTESVTPRPRYCFPPTPVWPFWRLSRPDSIVATAFRRRFRFIIWTVVLWIGVSILGQAIVPAMVQRFQVEPNELGVERDVPGSTHQDDKAGVRA